MKFPKWFRLPKWLKRKPPAWKVPTTEFVVEPAFNAGGTEYYRLVNTVNMPCHRAMAAIRYYEEQKMRTTHTYLEGLYKAILLSVNAGKLDEISVLVHQAKERLTWAFDPDLVYKLASVMFFDKSESPLKYDYAYNERKIKRWKKLELEDFFLQLPLLSFQPSLENLGTDLATYTKGARLKTEMQLTSILNIIANDPLSNSLTETLVTDREELRKWLKSND